MPTYTATLLTAKSDKFDTLENLILSGKSVRHVLDELEKRFDTTIRARKGPYYKLARSNALLLIERYSPSLPTLADFPDLPEPAPAPNLQEYRTVPRTFWCATILEATCTGYEPSETHTITSSTQFGAYRKLHKSHPADWQRHSHYWMDSNYRILTIGKAPTTPNLPLHTYSVELLPEPRATYSLKAHNPWHAAVILGDTLGVAFENRRYLDVTDRFDAPDGTYCLVHSKPFKCQFSI